MEVSFLRVHFPPPRNQRQSRPIDTITGQTEPHWFKGSPDLAQKLQYTLQPPEAAVLLICLPTTVLPNEARKLSGGPIADIPTPKLLGSTQN